jgi:putative DNA primase/helicase
MRGWRPKAAINSHRPFTSSTGTADERFIRLRAGNVAMTAQAPHGMAPEARSVRLESEIARRGIKLSAGITERCGPCPVCGGTDRFSVNLKKQVWNCRGCSRGGDVIELVRHLDGLSFGESVRLLTGAAPQKPAPGALHGAAGAPAKAVTQPPENSHKAAWLWGNREPVSESCPAWSYLRQTRHYAGSIPQTLGYLPPNGRYPPAVIAAYGFCDEPEPGVIVPPASVTGVHITRLTPEGGKAPEDKSKIMLGPMSGLPIVLTPVNDGLGLAITEGIEDGLSVSEETGLGVWAAGSAGNMPKIAAALPPYVECVTIFAHRDETGIRFAKEAARLIAAMGTEVHLKGRG